MLYGLSLIVLSSKHFFVAPFWREACGRATWVAPPWRTDAAGMQFKSPWLTHTITEHVWESHWPYISASLKWVIVPSALSLTRWSPARNKQAVSSKFDVRTCNTDYSSCNWSKDRLIAVDLNFLVILMRQKVTIGSNPEEVGISPYPTSFVAILMLFSHLRLYPWSSVPKMFE
jgi:hypothetical protein